MRMEGAAWKVKGQVDWSSTWPSLRRRRDGTSASVATFPGTFNDLGVQSEILSEVSLGARSK